MPNKDQLTELITEVIAATKRRELKWQETADEAQFICSFRGNKYLLKVKSYTEFDERGDRMGSACIELFRNSDDTLLLRVTPNDSYTHSYTEFEELFNMAKDQALGVDDALNEFLKELKEGKYREQAITDEDIPF